MAYRGQTFTIPLGRAGLLTDDPQTEIPPNALIRAENIRFDKGLVEKDRGSKKWNQSALGSGIIGLKDFIPTIADQKFISVNRDGEVYSHPNINSNVEVTASGSAPSTLNISSGIQMVTGGKESATRDKKLFIFSGNSPVQVISGSEITRTDISSPPADWSMSAQPTFGIIYRDRLVAFGNSNDPHRIYFSGASDHEDFTSSPLQFPIFPGEGEGLISATVFKGRLFFFKRPQGVYYLDDPSPTTSTWGIKKLTDSFGIASPNSMVQVLNDLTLKNSTGSLTSMSAVQAFGDIESGDILRNLRVEEYVREVTDEAGNPDTYAIYYEAKKQVYMTYRSAGGIKNDRILTFDFSTQNPKMSLNTKDQPNVLALRQDKLGVLRPFYGADDGYIYEMDRPDREINGSGYSGLFQIPHMDFGIADRNLAEKMKLFDFLEVTFEETGNWNLSVDVFIDREFYETLSFPLTKGAHMDSSSFALDSDEVIGRRPQSFRIPLHGTGRRISFRCYNSGLRQNFRIQALTVYFRVAGETQTA